MTLAIFGSGGHAKSIYDIVKKKKVYFFDKSKKEVQNHTWFENKESIDSFMSFSKKVVSKGGKILLFGPSPEFPHTIHSCLSEWFRPILPEECSISESQLRYLRKDIYEVISNLPEYIYVYDPKRALCRNEICSMTDSKGKPLYFDGNHLNVHANRNYIYPDFLLFLEENNLN